MRLPLALLVLLVLAPDASAQAAADSVRTVRLVVVDRQFVEDDYAAETALTVEDGRGLAVHVGAALYARRIAVRLRNVRGLVRLRADPSDLRAVSPRPAQAPLP